MLKKFSLLACLMATSVQAGPADGVAQVSILPGWTTDDGTQMAAFKITLQNLASAQFHWPTPEVMDQSGMRSIGYTDGVTVPVELTPHGSGDVTLAGDLVIGVCEEICVPVQLSFNATLPGGGKRDSAIVASLINRPLTAAEGGVEAATCKISPRDDGLTVTATLTLPTTGGDEVVVIEAGDPMIWVSESDVSRSGNQLTATSDMVHAGAGAFALDRSALRFTVFGSNHVVDIQGCTGG